MKLIYETTSGGVVMMGGDGGEPFIGDFCNIGCPGVVFIDELEMLDWASVYAFS